MSYHKLLQKQINKHFPEEFQLLQGFENFLQSVNESYLSFERDNELLNHAFSISEKEYKLLYENLNKEYDLKNQSIENLKNAIKNIENNNKTNFNIENNDILDIVEYINSEIQKRKGTEISLNQTLKLLTTLLSNLNSGILVFDERRKVLYTNQLFCDMLSSSYSPEIMTGMDCTNLIEQSKIYFEDPEMFPRRIEEILNRKISVFADELKLLDGRILERDYIPIYIDNQYKGHLWKYTDITERKKFELELIESNENLELFKTLINNTSDAIQVSKENGQLVYINNEASKRLGIATQDASKFKIKDFETNFKNDKDWYQHVSKVRRKDSLIIEGENINLNTNIKFPVEVTVRFLELNSIAYIIANSRDISERKQIEATIKMQKEKYQNIIANMNLGLLEVDLNENIQFVNPGFEFISGYNESELIGKNAHKLLVSESDNNSIIKNKNKLRAQGKSDMYEVPIKNKNGELKWWMISGAPNYDEKGNLIGSIGIHLDITDQKQLELDLELSKRKAEESSKAKEAFLANMSHEIRTPLNAIIGMIRELSKEKLSELQDTYVQNTSIASQHLLSVLNNILDISKIEAGELQLDLHHFDLQKILNDVKSIMLAKCGEKGLFLKINHVENKNVFFIGDSSRIRQILLNLIGNAVKFTNTGGITIEYDVQNLNPGYQTVYISVKDTGVGMDESYLKNIFNKFSQEDTSTSRKYGGSGLGMSITKELIELMNGVIEIKSKKNVGTTIHLKFLLPIGEPDKLLKEDFETIANNGRFLDILLVEDNEFNRLVAGNTLNHFNCTVTEAINGLEAINILKTGKIFDVILMDLQMPIMDGFESTKIIRNELKINTPIIALTANAFKSELEQCINIGMNDSVTKPFEEEKLINSIYKLTNFNSTNVNIEPTMLLNTDKLYNLHQLRIVSRNDTDYFKKMINIFIDQSNLSITQITESYLAKNLKDVYSVIHKIKPSIDLMGIEILKEPIKYVEKNAKDQIDSQELGTQIKFIFIILNKAILQLKAEI